LLIEMLILLSFVHSFLILSSSQPIYLLSGTPKVKCTTQPTYYKYNYKSVAKLDLIDTPLYAFIIPDL